MSAPLLSPTTNKLSSVSLGNKHKVHTDSDSYSADLLAGMRWLQGNVKLPPVLRNCLAKPLPQRGINITEWLKKDFRDRQKIQESTSITIGGLCTCGGNAHCLIHSHIKASSYQSSLLRAIRNAPEDNRIMYGTLTMSHGKNDRLDELIGVQTKAFMEMTRRKSWHKAFVGVEPTSGDGEVTWWFRHLECNYSLDFGYHPHIHFVASVNTGSNIDFIKKRLIKLWKENISAMTTDGTNNKGQIKVRRMTQEELMENGRSRYSASTKVGVDLIEVSRGSADEEKLATYFSKGITLEAASDFTMKTTKSSGSFSIPEIVLHASGVRPNLGLAKWEKEECWSDHNASSASEYWEACLARFHKSMLGRQIYRGCNNFRHYSEIDNKSDDKSGAIHDENAQSKKGRDMWIPPSVASKMRRGNAVVKFDFLRKDPDFQKALDLVQSIVTTQDFSLIKVTTPEDRKELIPPQSLLEPHGGVVISESAKVWNGLKKISKHGFKWAKMDDWEEGLISIGIKIRDGNGINNITEYKAQAEGFEFKVIDGIPMLRYVALIAPEDVVFPIKQVEDAFTPLPAGGRKLLKRAA